MAFTGLQTAVRNLLGSEESKEAVVALPDGLTPEEFIAAADAPKPAGYNSRVELALQHYFGLAHQDTVAALRRAFPKTADHMVPVQLRYARFVIDKQAAVFSGIPAFELTGEHDSAAWHEVVTKAELQRRMQQVNRRTLLCRTSFIRVTWDAECRRVRLAVFTPEKVHVLFQPDSRSLNEARGVLLDLEPAWVDGSPVKRWEFWSAGEEPRNFIIDEHGVISGEGENPYRNDQGKPIVPIVMFAEDDDDAGCWPLPSESLLSTARAINVNATSLRHVQMMQGFGQWISEVNEQEQSPESWSGERPRVEAPTLRDRLIGRNQEGAAAMTIRFGPDTLLQVPRGRTIRNEAPSVNVAEQDQANERFLRQNLMLESVPAAEMLGETRPMSGFALMVERLPLMELRIDQIERYRRPTEEVIHLVRIVHDAHQPDGLTRFGPGGVRFIPDDIDTPSDPATQNGTDTFLLQNKLTTRARILARREEITLVEAEARIAEVDAYESGADNGGTPTRDAGSAAEDSGGSGGPRAEATSVGA